MAEELERSERIWRCACHWSPHFVSIVADPYGPDVSNDPRGRGWFSVEVTDGTMPFRRRLFEAWKLLRSRGHRYSFAEVLLTPETARDMCDHLSRFLDNKEI